MTPDDDIQVAPRVKPSTAGACLAAALRDRWILADNSANLTRRPGGRRHLSLHFAHGGLML